MTDEEYREDRVGCWVQWIQMACTKDNHVALLREIVAGIWQEAQDSLHAEEEADWQRLMAAIEENRLSYRKRFTVHKIETGGRAWTACNQRTAGCKTTLHWNDTTCERCLKWHTEHL